MRDVIISRRALRDLLALAEWIAAQSDWDIAERYIARIEAACEKLSDYPERGTPRDDLAPGIRSIAFERRVVIAYRSDRNIVRIIRCIGSGRDPTREFS